MSTDDNTVLHIRTVQANIFSLLNENLKDILFEVNWEFTQEGIEIKAIDNSHSQFVHLELYADKFDSYYCKEKLILGIDMLYLHKLLKGSSNDDVLIFSYNSSNTSELKIEIHNDDSGIVKIYDLKLLDIDVQQHQELPMSDDSENVMMNIDTQRFKSICKDLGNISDTVELTCTGNELRFECNGTSARGSQTIELSSKNPRAYISNIQEDVIQGIFSLKTLYHFTKFSSLCITLELCFANDKPLRIKYTCADLGYICLYLAPFMEDC
jgi:proliferating cell nuclear antigen